VINVSAFGFANFAAVTAAASDVGLDVLIHLDTDDSVTLLGVHVSDLVASNFLL
jgi:hypothetical protein